MNIHGNMEQLDYWVIGLYLVALLTLGFWVSYTRRDSDDLFLAGRSLGWFNIGLSIFGTNVNPSFMIASCSIAYTSGMVAANFEWMAWPFLMLLAMVFVPQYLNTKICTMPEFMSRRYNESCRVFLSCYTVFSTLIVWLGMTLFTGGLLLGQILGWPLWLSVLLLITIAASFTITGGLAAVVITDSFQSILMILASIALTIIGLVKVGGISQMIQSVPPETWHLFRSKGEFPWYAVLLGYPVSGLWFWCTDQTIVQRVLGGRTIKQSQQGCVFAAFLKILTPLIFFTPGILCKILHPELGAQLNGSDQAYMMMVTNYLPSGMVGLIIAVLIAALISTVDSGLNSLSTVFTLDIYCKYVRPDANSSEKTRIGRIVTVAAAILSIFLALGIGSIERVNLFSMLQSILAFLAPPLAVVFLLGAVWPRVNATGALWTLIVGSIVSISIGLCHMLNFPYAGFWPHFMVLAFFIFSALIVFMIIVSLFTKPSQHDQSVFSLRRIYRSLPLSFKNVWLCWAMVTFIMGIIYIVFD
jgi:SSS family solute:Na+ symporter